MQKWINIQKILGGIGRESIKHMIAERKIEKIGLDVALGAKEMLRGLQIEEVRAKSAGAATFYVWVCTTEVVCIRTVQCSCTANTVSFSARF